MSSPHSGVEKRPYDHRRDAAEGKSVSRWVVVISGGKQYEALLAGSGKGKEERSFEVWLSRSTPVRREDLRDAHDEVHTLNTSREDLERYPRALVYAEDIGFVGLWPLWNTYGFGREVRGYPKVMLALDGCQIFPQPVAKGSVRLSDLEKARVEEALERRFSALCEEEFRLIVRSGESRIEMPPRGGRSPGEGCERRFLREAASNAHPPRGRLGFGTRRESAGEKQSREERLRRAADHLKGADGEILVGRELDKLGEGYYVAHDLPLFREGKEVVDADHVVVGPPGILVVDTKNQQRDWMRRIVRVGPGGSPSPPEVEPPDALEHLRDAEGAALSRLVREVEALLGAPAGIASPILCFVHAHVIGAGLVTVRDGAYGGCEVKVTGSDALASYITALPPYLDTEEAARYAWRLHEYATASR